MRILSTIAKVVNVDIFHGLHSVEFSGSINRMSIRRIRNGINKSLNTIIINFFNFSSEFVLAPIIVFDLSCMNFWSFTVAIMEAE